MNIELIDGRNFNPDMSSDKTAIIVNETLVKQLNWDNPIGKYIHRNRKNYIIGVVKDFHFLSLHHKIEPLILTIQPWQNLISLKINELNNELISDAREAWDKTIGNEPFEYELLEKDLADNYRTEDKLLKH